MAKLLIIDDDTELTELLSDYLVQQGFNVDVENSPNNGIDALKRSQYDLLLLDVMMPDIDGFEVLKTVRQFSEISVIMLTAKGDDYDKILGLELGADDYLPKPFNQRELVARIKALIRRSTSANNLAKAKQYHVHGIELNEANQSVKACGEQLDFTATEFMMLAHLMKNLGNLQSKEVLSQAVLGKKLSAFDRSIDMHVSNVRKKLSAAGISDIIKTVRGNGYFMQQEA